jgi:putative MATE family efflux protein
MLAMAIPVIIATIVQSTNSLIDALWVSLLGPEEIAAVGLVFPLYFITIGIGEGIGIGASSLISRRIGNGDRRRAEHSASQAFVLSLIVSIIATAILLPLLEPTLVLMGAGSILGVCLDYSVPLFIGTVFTVHLGVMSAILRSEGASKRSMSCEVLGAALNMVFDPLFMFGFGWGIAGDAWATVAATFCGLMLTFYWYFIKKDCYLLIYLRGFRFDRAVDRIILSVGIPAIFETVVTSFASMAINMVLIGSLGSDSVATFSTAWRIVQLMEIPMLGIAAAIVPVCAAAYGMMRLDKVDESFYFGLIFGAAMTLLIGASVALFADQIAYAFTSTDEEAHLRAGVATFLRIAAIFTPFSALGTIASSLFQAFGKGMYSLAIIAMINLAEIPVCYVQVMLGQGLYPVYWGICITEIIGGLIGTAWALLSLRLVNRTQAACYS